MSNVNPSEESNKLAGELFAEHPTPTARDVAEYLDIVRAIEYKEASRAGIQAVVRAQLEVIDQCIQLVGSHNKTGLVTPGMGPRRTIGKAIEAMKKESARLRGIDEYVPPARKSTIIAEPNTVALPKGEYK